MREAPQRELIPRVRVHGVASHQSQAGRRDR
jgi:hypothetical protein